MVFNVQPHKNRGIPLSFLRKMYAKCVLGKLVNYFHHLEFHDACLDIPHNWPNVRNKDDQKYIIPWPCWKSHFQRSFFHEHKNNYSSWHKWWYFMTHLSRCLLYGVTILMQEHRSTSSSSSQPTHQARIQWRR